MVEWPGPRQAGAEDPSALGGRACGFLRMDAHPPSLASWLCHLSGELVLVFQPTTQGHSAQLAQPTSALTAPLHSEAYTVPKGLASVSLPSTLPFLVVGTKPLTSHAVCVTEQGLSKCSASGKQMSKSKDLSSGELVILIRHHAVLT